MTEDDLVTRIEELLFIADPIGINFETNTDEYAPEARTIVPRLPAATSRDDVQRIVHEEFVRWFDADIAGPPQRYRDIAEGVWRLWTSREAASEAMPDSNP